MAIMQSAFKYWIYVKRLYLSMVLFGNVYSVIDIILQLAAGIYTPA